MWKICNPQGLSCAAVKPPLELVPVDVLPIFEDLRKLEPLFRPVRLRYPVVELIDHAKDDFKNVQSVNMST